MAVEKTIAPQRRPFSPLLLELPQKRYVLGGEQEMGKNWPRRVRKTLSPEQTTFLTALWAIIGSTPTEHAEAAKIIGVPLKYLRDLFEGRRKPVAEIIRHQKWSEKLSQHYGERWSEHGLGILAFVPPSGIEPTTRRHTGSWDYVNRGPGHAFGTVLSNIIGKDEPIKRAAALLGTNATTLGSILRGRQRPSRALVFDNDWPGRLATHYPVGWARHGELLSVLIRELAPGRGAWGGRRRRKA